MGRRCAAYCLSGQNQIKCALSRISKTALTNIMNLRTAAFVAFVQVVLAAQAVPVLIASHRVVPNLKTEISNTNFFTHNVTSVTKLVKKLVTQCSSDEYIIINQPGLSFLDLTADKKEDWPFIRKYAMLASTVIGLPRVAEPLDLDFIEQYIIRNCEAETIKVVNDDEEEVQPYYDTRTRVIRIDLSELPEDRHERVATIREHDNLIRLIIRKLPSPHYTIILTSEIPSILHPAPEDIMLSYPDKFEIFDDIVNDPKRKEEIERNVNFHQVDPQWNENKNTNDRYLRNKKQDEIHFFDMDLWNKHEGLITTVLVMITTIVAIKVSSILRGLVGRVQERVANKRR